MSDPDEREVIDVGGPNAARMYDYYLGGSANFEVDRAAAEVGRAAMPDAETYARANRAFLGRAVRYLCSVGIDQFLDLGSGIPTKGNVHEIAQGVNPRARVAYVDIESVAVAHSRRMLAQVDGVTITRADIRRPEVVLSAPGVAGLLDFDRPIAVLAVAILPFVPDDVEAAAVLAAYRQACAPGSYLAISHISQLAASAEQVAAAEQVMARTPTPVKWRSADRIAPLLDGYEIVPPGLLPVPLWRPDGPVEPEQVVRANAFGAVGVLR
ncbi:SAM-dependent methyltransferase [Saccharopolyspora sp. WRP15-2]|uniref:SAM-dependent methyltransferase n=1 Tax=Saccharopolyspora oryzae TaxID=2997343 RepID=A0ABT4V6J0_9PSEU|nr:SAM-dependent methyltransferase [Saccharopolyspora oryzae]MDA3629594.1 SAM-dependent methyltransferase [Saccharopolyspora oryzae]